jgi:hypothetical protein
MKEFKVNEFIILKLEEEIISEEEGLRETKTNIYVKGELFRQCSFLLINIPIEEMTSFDSIESIDEAEERLGTSLEEGNESFEYKIPPKTEFWGHCSNIQVWAENNYDTRLIHRYLAFPLLKRLTEVGDPVARRVFKEEIAKRFTSCYLPLIHILLFEGYLDYLSEEELGTVFSEVIRRNKLLFLYLEPVLMIKGYLKYELSKKEFDDYLNKFNAEVESGKFLPLKRYENFIIEHNYVLNWLYDKIYEKEKKR